MFIGEAMIHGQFQTSSESYFDHGSQTHRGEGNCDPAATLASAYAPALHMTWLLRRIGVEYLPGLCSSSSFLFSRRRQLFNSPSRQMEDFSPDKAKEQAKTDKGEKADIERSHQRAEQQHEHQRNLVIARLLASGESIASFGRDDFPTRGVPIKPGFYPIATIVSKHCLILLPTRCFLASVTRNISPEEEKIYSEYSVEDREK